MKTWTTRDIPSQQGRVAIVTGATGGLGYETALALASAGAQVVLAGRDPDKGARALRAIRAVHPAAAISFELLDLARLDSVQAFAGRFTRTHQTLDILVNNAGVMAPPKRQGTVDGFELQFGTNYLGHYALTEQLLVSLMHSGSARVVNLSSVAHRYGASIHFDDLNWLQCYQPFAAYGQSKLAMLMFTLELQRRSDVRGWGLLCAAAHPGLARTALLRNGQRLAGDGKVGWMEKLGGWLPEAWAQSAGDGALSILYAATSPDVVNAGYYGPTGFLELTGPVGCATVSQAAGDKASAIRLWDVSEEMTGAYWTAAQGNLAGNAVLTSSPCK
jgi:NAD(P)-dependent dehydrogenase (short-subunit alcohol dehydrogenase family)